METRLLDLCETFVCPYCGEKCWTADVLFQDTGKGGFLPKRYWPCTVEEWRRLEVERNKEYQMYVVHTCDVCEVVFHAIFHPDAVETVLRNVDKWIVTQKEDGNE